MPCPSLRNSVCSALVRPAIHPIDARGPFVSGSRGTRSDSGAGTVPKPASSRSGYARTPAGFRRPAPPSDGPASRPGYPPAATAATRARTHPRAPPSGNPARSGAIPLRPRTSTDAAVPLPFRYGRMRRHTRRTVRSAASPRGRARIRAERPDWMPYTNTPEHDHPIHHEDEPRTAILTFREQADGRKVSRLPGGKVVLVNLPYADMVGDGQRWRVRLRHRETYAVADPLERILPGPTEAADAAHAPGRAEKVAGTTSHRNGAHPLAAARADDPTTAALPELGDPANAAE